jgi:hypothetical protein
MNIGISRAFRIKKSEYLEYYVSFMKKTVKKVAEICMEGQINLRTESNTGQT